MNFIHRVRYGLEQNGYGCITQMEADVFMQAPSGEHVWVCYLDKEIKPEGIRRAFDFKGHVLFVVNDKLIPDQIESREATPMWLRILHGLYMGRVYTWNGRFLYGLHFDYDTGDISESGIIQPDSLLLVDTGTWLRGWAGTYKLARFYDRSWWTENASQSQGDPSSKQWDKTWDEYEKVRREYEERVKRDNQRYHQYNGQWTPPNSSEPPPRYKYGGSEQKQNKQSYGYYGGTGKTPPPPKQETQGRDFLGEFRACKSEAELKKLYRKTAREFHPDVNKEPNATVTMQFINLAYEKAKIRWE